MRIIGVEFRLEYQSRDGVRREEIGIAPCQIQIHVPKENLVPFGTLARLSGTVHTDYGDFNFGEGRHIDFGADLLNRQGNYRVQVKQD